MFLSLTFGKRRSLARGLLGVFDTDEVVMDGTAAGGTAQ
jgi:hypothetical protein